MDPRFLAHNTHHESAGLFRSRDPQLRVVARQPLVFEPPLLDVLPEGTPGIYTVGGGRQVGKTTLLKLWMARLLDRGVDPARITYLTGELIDDHHTLIRLIEDAVEPSAMDALDFLIVDEITYISGWDRAVKFAADAGMLERTVLVLTGSDLALARDARMTFPGRRGTADLVDFELHPLSFREAFDLKTGGELSGRLTASADVIDGEILADLETQLLAYLEHGGFLTAINDIAVNGEIAPATMATYSDWIRGDVLKRGKREQYLREVLGAVVERMGSQITWNALARDLSIDHPKTVSDYVDLLRSMGVLFDQPALIEDKLVGAPKKARKLSFSDPFVFHATRAWLRPTRRPYEDQLRVALEDPRWTSRLVEACVASHVRRHHPTYYIKAEGEVDVAYVDRGRFWPIEVKWARQLKPKDLKQIRKYPQARIWARTRRSGDLDGVRVEPLPLALYRFG